MQSGESGTYCEPRRAFAASWDSQFLIDGEQLGIPGSPRTQPSWPIAAYLVFLLTGAVYGFMVHRFRPTLWFYRLRTPPGMRNMNIPPNGDDRPPPAPGCGLTTSW